MGLLWFVATTFCLSKKLDLVGGTSLVGSAIPINMQTVIMVELKSTAIGFWNLLFYKVNTGLSQKAVCYFKEVINHYFSQKHIVS